MLKVELIGNIGADAEVKDYQGNKFVTFRVAHSSR
jgi:single-stranded DNA-binding protein